jgi:hypothetical protein
MAILDELLEFCDNVDVSATAGTALVGDVIDLGSQPQDLGSGEPMYLVIQTGATSIITGGSAGTIQFQLASDAAAAIAVNGSASTHVLTPTYVTDGNDANAAALDAGGVIYVGALPTGAGVAYERYLGVLVTTATTTTTAGTINAFLTKDPKNWVALPDAVN